MSTSKRLIWKAEPFSPSGNSIGEAEDDWIYIDDNSLTLLNDDFHPKFYNENNSARAQVATKLLEELDEWIKEEPVSDWLEEKVESLFDELPSPDCGQNKPIVYPIVNINAKPQPPTTQLLLQEFETVLGDVEACHQFYPSSSNSTTLTPPQSPPATITEQLPPDTQLLVTLQPVVENIELIYQQPIINVDEVNESVAKSDSYLGQICGEWNAENVSLLPLAGDVASELAAVDEYVRSCAEDLSPSSPVTSSSASCVSSEDSVDDPDWSIEISTRHHKSSSRSSSPDRNRNNNNYSKRNQRLTKNRHKPYSRPSVEDKKVRKKEQNKNAATRYRQKKKQEITEIIGEEQELMNHNDKLRDDVKELKREIGYLKGLMRDLFKAKGLIN